MTEETEKTEMTETENVEQEIVTTGGEIILTLKNTNGEEITNEAEMITTKITNEVTVDGSNSRPAKVQFEKKNHGHPKGSKKVATLS